MGRLGCLIIGAVILVAIGLVLGLGLPKWLGGGVDLSSPKHTVNSFLDAEEDQDAGRMADCCDFPLTYWGDTIADREEFIVDWEDVFEHVDSLKISDINKTKTNETGDTAIVHATYTLTLEGIPIPWDEYYDLVKIGDNWYITRVHPPL